MSKADNSLEEVLKKHEKEMQSLSEMGELICDVEHKLEQEQFKNEKLQMKFDLMMEERKACKGLEEWRTLFIEIFKEFSELQNIVDSKNEIEMVDFVKQTFSKMLLFENERREEIQKLTELELMLDQKKSQIFSVKKESEMLKSNSKKLQNENLIKFEEINGRIDSQIVTTEEFCASLEKRIETLKNSMLLKIETDAESRKEVERSLKDQIKLNNEMQLDHSNALARIKLEHEQKLSSIFSEHQNEIELLKFEFTTISGNLENDKKALQNEVIALNDQIADQPDEDLIQSVKNVYEEEKQQLIEQFKEKEQVLRSELDCASERLISVGLQKSQKSAEHEKLLLQIQELKSMNGKLINEVSEIEIQKTQIQNLCQEQRANQSKEFEQLQSKLEASLKENTEIKQSVVQIKEQVEEYTQSLEAENNSLKELNGTLQAEVESLKKQPVNSEDQSEKMEMSKLLTDLEAEKFELLQKLEQVETRPSRMEMQLRVEIEKIREELARERKKSSLKISQLEEQICNKENKG